MIDILEVFEYNQHFVAMMNIINSARLCNNKVGHKHHIIPRSWFKWKGTHWKLVNGKRVYYGSSV